mgnify:CR=1 FL=1
MDELGFGLDLIIILVAAILGGLLARRLKLPIILGYLAAGIVVGPHGFGLISELDTIQTIATVGVVLLLFTLGLEFSLDELKKMGRIALIGGTIQILLTAAAGLALGKLLGWQTAEAIFFGFLIALSSTMIVLKVLMERGELDASHGRVMIGILLVQDLSLVPLMIILPALGGDGSGIWPELGIAVLKALLFIGLMLVLGLWVIPRLLGRVAGVRSRELFLLSVILLSLGAAIGAVFFGISAAVGAFIAGLFIGQSIFARQAFADILPLRDIFGAVFFISLGMLADIAFAWENITIVTLVVVFIILVKFTIGSAITWFFGYGLKAALLAGLGLFQIGEFSFVLAEMGLDEGIIAQDIYSIVLVGAVITMMLTPLAMNTAGFLYRNISQWKRFGHFIASHPEPGWHSDRLLLSGHAVICGHGRVGSALTKVLDRKRLSYLVIEIDPVIISRLRREKIPCIYGDATNAEILAHAHLDKARVMVCTFPSFAEVKFTVQNALKINPRLDIIARVHRDTDAEVLKGIGVSELVLPEFETSLEIMRHTLHRLGLTTLEIQYILNSLRRRSVPRD